MKVEKGKRGVVAEEKGGEEKRKWEEEKKMKKRMKISPFSSKRVELELSRFKLSELEVGKYQVFPRLKEQIIEKLEKFKWELQRELEGTDPFRERREELEWGKERYRIGDFHPETFRRMVEKYRKISNRDYFFWEWKAQKFEELALQSPAPFLDRKLKKRIKVAMGGLLRNWERDLELLYSRWREQLTEKRWEEFKKRIREWVEKQEEIYLLLRRLSFGGEIELLFPGLGFDKISRMEIEELKKWWGYISETPNLRKLLQMMGRLKGARRGLKRELVSVQQEIVVTKKRSVFKNELDGIKLDNDLSNLLPQELMLLGSEEEILFFKKFLERGLSCFETVADREIEEEERLLKEEQEWREVEEEEKGPIIICVDTSGSMAGEPEFIAKAVTLYLAMLAKREERDCFLINFSTSIETFEFSKESGFQELIQFLKLSFHGGTDVAPALDYATQLMKGKYKKGDLLVISDFILDNLPGEILKNMEEARRRKNRFFSLVIGGNRGVNLRYFDKVWVFNSVARDVEMFEEFDEVF